MFALGVVLTLALIAQAVLDSPVASWLSLSAARGFWAERTTTATLTSIPATEFGRGPDRKEPMTSWSAVVSC